MKYYPPKLHITRCDVSSVIAIMLKAKDNYTYHVVAVFFCILQKHRTGIVRIT